MSSGAAQSAKSPCNCVRKPQAISEWPPLPVISLLQQLRRAGTRQKQRKSQDRTTRSPLKHLTGLEQGVHDVFFHNSQKQEAQSEQSSTLLMFSCMFVPLKKPCRTFAKGRLIDGKINKSCFSSQPRGYTVALQQAKYDRRRGSSDGGVVACDCAQGRFIYC